MNSSRSVRTNAQRVLAELYSIDIEELSPDDKASHRELLNEAYLALLKLEDSSFEQTLLANQDALEQLEQATESLAEALKQEKKLSKKLQLAARGLEIIKKFL